VERLIKCLGCAVNFLPVSRTQGFAKRLHFGDDLFPIGIAEFVVLITKVLPGVPQKQPAMFDVTRRKHEFESTTVLPFRAKSSNLSLILEQNPEMSPLRST
jgi:hypothetical protein